MQYHVTWNGKNITMKLTFYVPQSGFFKLVCFILSVWVN